MDVGQFCRAYKYQQIHKIGPHLQSPAQVNRDNFWLE